MNIQPTLFGPAPARPTREDVLKRCKVIYEPRGRAREYAALACNVYTGCGHGCIYCYVPGSTRKTVEQFSQPATRGPTFLKRLAKDAQQFREAGLSGRVLLSFTCDPYQPLDVTEGVTRDAIGILHAGGLDVQVLTKGGSRALRDLDLFTDRDAFATTMTTLDNRASQKWERNAALPADRIATMKLFHEAGVPTWVSLEPVLIPDHSVAIISRTHPYVDLFKVGKLNHHRLADSIDWAQFAHDAIDTLEYFGYERIGMDDEPVFRQKCYYIKKDLAAFL